MTKNYRANFASYDTWSVNEMDLFYQSRLPRGAILEECVTQRLVSLLLTRGEIHINNLDYFHAMQNFRTPSQTYPDITPCPSILKSGYAYG